MFAGGRGAKHKMNVLRHLRLRAATFSVFAVSSGKHNFAPFVFSGRPAKHNMSCAIYVCDYLSMPANRRPQRWPENRPCIIRI